MKSYNDILKKLEAFEYEEAKEMLRCNIREEAAKSKGHTSASKYKIIERVMKNNKDNHNKILSKASLQDDGRYVFLESWRLFFSDDSYGYDVEKEHPFRASEFLKSDYSDSATLDLDEITRYIKIKGYKRTSAHPDPYMFKTDKGTIMTFNPYGLLDLIDYSGCNKVLCNGKKHPIISENKLAVVLPVINNDDEYSYEKWHERIFG